jgi:energy-coupling factor transport system permease protein
MRGAFVYRRVPGSLGSARPWIAAVYLLPLALIAFTFSSPLVLAGTGLAAVGIALLAGVPEAVRTPLRWALPLVAMVVLVNGLVAQRGATILYRFGDLPLLGPTNLTLEALAEGAVLGGRIVVSLIVFAIWSACVDPDRILRGMRPLARHSALTATLISRLVPLAAEDVRRLGEAAQLRGPAAAPVGKSAIARRMIAGALERSVDVAATLELRGYALGGTRRLVRNRRLSNRGRRRAS